jgi:hypothetical protein
VFYLNWCFFHISHNLLYKKKIVSANCLFLLSQFNTFPPNMTSRLQLFKNAGGHAATSNRQRWNRVQGAVMLRKQQRDRSLCVRRNLDDNGSIDEDALTEILQGDVAAMLHSAVPDAVLQARLVVVRRAMGDGQPVDYALQHRVVPPLMALLQSQLSPAALNEVAWALVKISSGPTELCQAIASSGGGVGSLMYLATNTLPTVAENLLWVLGNIASDCSAARDHLMTEGVVAFLTHLASGTSLPPAVINQMAFLATNLVQYESRAVADALWPVLVWLLHHASVNRDGVVHVLWGINHLLDHDVSSTDDVAMRLVVEGETLQCVGALVVATTPSTASQPLSASDLAILLPALRVLSAIATIESNTTLDALLAADARLVRAVGVIAGGASPLRAPNYLRKEALYILSNMAVGRRDQVAPMATTPGVAEGVAAALAATSFSVRDEATHVLHALAQAPMSRETMTVVTAALTAAHAPRALVEMLASCGAATTPADTLLRILNGLFWLLEHDAALQQFVEWGGGDAINMLQDHAHTGVRQEAAALADTFLTCEEEDALSDGENSGWWLAAGSNADC